MHGHRTASKDAHVNLASFDESVAGYVVKPVVNPQFDEPIRTLDLFSSIFEAA